MNWQKDKDTSIWVTHAFPWGPCFEDGVLCGRPRLLWQTKKPLDVYKRQPLLNGIFHMQGEIWKKMRNKLSPGFSTGKMKMMFPIMKGCSQQLKLALDNICKISGTFEAKDLTSRFAIDIIVNSVFGLHSSSVLDCECHFYKTGL